MEQRDSAGVEDVVSAAVDDDEGGEPACWANRVCPECGRLNERRDPVVCEQCGARFEDV